jgi:hypothetical protein
VTLSDGPPFTEDPTATQASVVEHESRRTVPVVAGSVPAVVQVAPALVEVAAHTCEGSEEITMHQWMAAHPTAWAALPGSILDVSLHVARGPVDV